jgi:hypothetical protein
MADPIALQDFTGVLQNVYLPIRKKIFPINTVLLANARKLGPEHVTYAGNDLFFDVKVDRRGGFTSSNIGALPESKVAKEKQGRLSVARTYAKAQVDGLALKANSSTRGSYISTAKKVIEDIMDQWQLEQERILQSDSLGIRAVVTSGVASATQTVDDPYGITDAGPGNLHLTIGDTVSFRSPDGVTLRGKRLINNITLSGNVATLALDSSVTTTTGDIVVSAVPAAVHATDDSFGAEPHGLKSIMDVENAFATFEGLADDRWVAVKDTSSTLDEMIVMRHLMKIQARSGTDYQKSPRNTMLITTPGIWLAYGESLLGLRRFAAPTMELKGGFTGVQVANATLVRDEWAPRGRMYSVYGPDTVFIDLMDFGEVSFQDAPKWQRAANFDRWEAAFASYWNYGASNRISHGVISGITDTVNFSPVF